MSTFVDKLVKIPEEMKVLLWFYQSGPFVPDKKFRDGTSATTENQLLVQL